MVVMLDFAMWGLIGFAVGYAIKRAIDYAKSAQK